MVSTSHIYLCAAWLHNPQGVMEVKVLSETSERKKGKNMTVEEAGKLGGQRVRRLVEEGKEHEQE